MDEGALKLETELKGTQDHSFRNRKTRNELGGNPTAIESGVRGNGEEKWTRTRYTQEFFFFFFKGKSF